MLVKNGAIVVAQSGSLGGTTFSRNTYGSIARTKVTPVNRSTTLQQNVRSNFTACAQAWRGLTDAQRAAWAALATQVSRTNIFGDSVQLTAFNLFVRLNRNCNAIGATALTNAPTLPTMSAISLLTVTAAAGTPALSAVFGPDPVPTGFKMIMSATPGMSAGISFVKSEFRQLVAVAAGGTSPENLLTLYNAKYGALVAGQRIFVKAKLVHILSGLDSVSLQATCIVAA